jgi:hypothetical protein
MALTYGIYLAIVLLGQNFGGMAFDFNTLNSRFSENQKIISSGCHTPISSLNLLHILLLASKISQCVVFGQVSGGVSQISFDLCNIGLIVFELNKLLDFVGISDLGVGKTRIGEGGNRQENTH